MRKFEDPIVEVQGLNVEDVITTSPEVEACDDELPADRG